MEKERVRICDIAEELGLSTATVSNVIHGKTKKVSAETVKRVQELLEKREYIPNMAGILLAQNDSKIIGVVINNHEKYEGHVLEDGFIAASVNALSYELDAAGYFMMIKTMTQWQDIKKFASMWNLAGLVLIGFCEQDYQSLREDIRVPFVIYDGSLERGERLVNLVIDNYDGGRQMGEHLKTLGHKKVLCISDNDAYMDYERFLGLKGVLPQAQLLLIPMEKSVREMFYEKRWQEICSYTAVFAVSDYYAVDLLSFLREKGIRVPRDISIAGFDDSSLARQVQPALTTIGQNHTQRAKLAVELIEKLKNHERVDLEYRMSVKLIERASTGRVII